MNLMEEMELARLSCPTTPAPGAMLSRPNTTRAGSRPSSAAPVRDLTSLPGRSGRKLWFNLYHLDRINPVCAIICQPRNTQNHNNKTKMEVYLNFILSKKKGAI